MCLIGFAQEPAARRLRGCCASERLETALRRGNSGKVCAEKGRESI